MNDILFVSSNSELFGLQTRGRFFEARGFQCQVVDDLSAAYHRTEHDPPMAVVVDGELALRPEFEVLVLLFDALAVRCLVVSGLKDDAARIAEVAARTGAFVSERDEVFTKLERLSGQKRRPTNYTQQPKAASRDEELYDGIILIGASTGGVDALLKVLSGFSGNCPPTMVVQHTGPGFTAGLADLLNARVRPKVIEARDTQMPRRGHVFLAPGGARHLELGRKLEWPLCLTSGAAVSGHCPSVDTLFLSAVRHAGCVSAALLTGMGRDGAEGLLALRKAGATTFAQDRATSTVFGMPKAAADLGAAQSVLSLDQIGPALLRSRMKVVVS